MPKQRQPDKICRVSGHAFYLYKYYEESCGDYIIDYPNFEEQPVYTDEGRPFVMAIQECCPHGKSAGPDDPDPGDCSGCVYLHLEAPADAIGVCICEERVNAECRIEGRG